jgi:hypothetical protein
VCESSRNAPGKPAVAEDVGVPSARQAASERRGEGEPELDRRSAPSHPSHIMRQPSVRASCRLSVSVVTLAPRDRSLMAGGRVKGTGRTHNRSFWPFWRATGSAATIDTRRAETQSGSAAPQAQESVTRPAGGGRPNPPRSHLHRTGRRAPNERALVHRSDSVRFLRYLRQARLDVSTPVRDPTRRFADATDRWWFLAMQGPGPRMLPRQSLSIEPPSDSPCEAHPPSAWST